MRLHLLAQAARLPRGDPFILLNSRSRPALLSLPQVTDTKVNPATNATYINGVNYYLEPHFEWGMYNSCKSVQFPGTLTFPSTKQGLDLGSFEGSNQLAIELVCGRSIDRCDPPTWLLYIGDKAENSLVPFQINFITNFTAVDPPSCLPYLKGEGFHRSSCPSLPP